MIREEEMDDKGRPYYVEVIEIKIGEAGASWIKKYLEKNGEWYKYQELLKSTNTREVIKGLDEIVRTAIIFAIKNFDYCGMNLVKFSDGKRKIVFFISFCLNIGTSIFRVCGPFDVIHKLPVYWDVKCWQHLNSFTNGCEEEIFPGESIKKAREIADIVAETLKTIEVKA